MNGVGSVGAILEGLLVPRIAEHYGWGALFPVLVVLGTLAALALVPTVFWVRAPRTDPVEAGPPGPG